LPSRSTSEKDAGRCFAIKKHLREGRREVLRHQEAPPGRTQGGALPSRSTSEKDAGRRFAIKKHLQEAPRRPKNVGWNKFAGAVTRQKEQERTLRAGMKREEVHEQHEKSQKREEEEEEKALRAGTGKRRRGATNNTKNHKKERRGALGRFGLRPSCREK